MADASPDIPAHLPAALEAVFFAAEHPIGLTELCEVVGRVDETVAAPETVRAAVEAVASSLRERGGGFVLAEVGGGWELRTRPEHADWVHAMYRRRPVRLSRAALEVLSIVAYRQPCTRAQIDEIRGVDSSSTLRQLLERELVRILGKADDVGRPLVYGTTPGFLSFFGLTNLAELPTLREYTELSAEHMVKVQELDETLRANEQQVREAEAATDLAEPNEPPTEETEPPPEPELPLDMGDDGAHADSAATDAVDIDAADDIEATEPDTADTPRDLDADGVSDATDDET